MYTFRNVWGRLDDGDEMLFYSNHLECEIFSACSYLCSWISNRDVRFWINNNNNAPFKATLQETISSIGILWPSSKRSIPFFFFDLNFELESFSLYLFKTTCLIEYFNTFMLIYVILRFWVLVWWFSLPLLSFKCIFFQNIEQKYILSFGIFLAFTPWMELLISFNLP